MKRFVLILALCFLSVFSVHGRGKKEETKKEFLNTEYVLFITAFDVSALPPSQQALGPILQRELARDFIRIHYRLRNGEELARYEELAWAAAKHAAALKLAEKRKERDDLLYRGYPRWKYKKELKRITKELAALEEEYSRAETEKPLVEGRPLFKLSEANARAEGTFLPAPAAGEEETFLRNNNADAFLTGKFRIVYGRIYGEFHIFARGASFRYEDSTIFSPEDLNVAAAELKDRFLTALAGSDPVRLVLYSDPEDARIELGGMTVQSGETVTVVPGPLSITVSAEGHKTAAAETETESGEEIEYSFVLKPLAMEKFIIKLPDGKVSVYSGALYMGGQEAPPEVPAETESADAEDAETEDEESVESAESDSAETDSTGDTEEAQGHTEIAPAESTEAEAENSPVETEASETENAVTETDATETDAVDGGEIAEGLQESAETEEPHAKGFFTLAVPLGEYQYIRIDTEDGLTGEAIVQGAPREDGEVRIITLKPRKLPGKDDKPVEQKRKKFYGAYGRFWIALPLAFFINGVSQTYIRAFTNTQSEGLFNKGNTLYYVSGGAWAVAGIFLAETLIRMGIYIHSASRESIPLQK